MKPYYEHGGIKIYHGDCREILPILDFACMVSDPPYGLGVEFGRNNATVIGDEDTAVRDFALQVLGDRAALVFGSHKVPRPTSTRMVLIWDKSELTGMGDLEFPWKLTHEEIYVIGSGFASSFRAGSVLRVPLRMPWTNHPQAVTGEHPTEKPVELMRRLIRTCPLGTVCDPFAGSGATLEAAKQLGRQAIGIEIEEKYCEIAAGRLSQEVFQF